MQAQIRKSCFTSPLLLVLRDKFLYDTEKVIVDFEEVLDPDRVAFPDNMEGLFERMLGVIETDKRPFGLGIIAGTVGRDSRESGSVATAESRNQRAA